jgi:hypothetical protein
VSLVVIAVLAVIWVVCLTPMMLRKLSERRFTTSVDSFHRQLRGLRRAYPRLAANAADPQAALYVGELAGTGEPVETWEPVHRSRSKVAYPPRPGSSSAARRRRVLSVLAGATIGFFVLGMIPALRVLLGLSLLAFAAAAGYLALLIYIHRRAVERQVKVIDIRDLRSDPAAALAVSEPYRRNFAEEMNDEDLDAAFEYDYDEIMAGGR